MKKTVNAIAPIFDGKPYIFLSYAHKNPQLSLKIAEILQEEGFRVWYDYGLKPGNQYHAIIDVRIRNCAVIIPVLSVDYCKSDFCSFEFLYARDQCAKPVVPIFTEKPEILKKYYKPGLGLMLSGIDGFIITKEEDLSYFRKKIHENEYLFPCNKTSDRVMQQGKVFEGDQNDWLSTINWKSNSKYFSFDDYLKNNGVNAVQEKKNSAVIESLLLVVKKKIQEKNFAEVHNYLDSILMEDPRNPDALLFQLLVKYHVNSINELASLHLPLDPVDVRAAAIYQNPECKKMLFDALEQNRQYQQYLIASSHKAAGHYQEALDIFEKIPDFRDTSQLILECRECIAKDTLLGKYEEEVGDGKQYLYNKLAELLPEYYGYYVKLCRETASVPSHDVIFFIVIGLLLGALGAGLLVIPNNNILIVIAIVFSIFIGFIISEAGSKMGGICFGVLAIILLAFRPSIFGVVILLIAFLSVLISVIEDVEYKKYKKAMAEKEKFYIMHIKDFEEGIRKKVETKYAAILPEDRKEILSIDEYISQDS